MLRQLSILCGLFNFLSLLSITDYQQINNQLGLLKADPMKTLTMIEHRINGGLVVLSLHEREELIQQLTELQDLLCSRPGAGLLILPILATIFFGVRSFYYYHEARAWSESDLIWPLMFGLQRDALDKCADSFMWCMMGIVVSMVTNLEYQEHVSALFAKERAIKRKINTLIALLKQ